MCDCIEKADEKLADRNTRVSTATSLATGTSKAMVATMQVETGRGKKKASAVAASYCPFCGEKYGGPQ